MTTRASADRWAREILYDARYLDIVADSRIVTADAVNVDDRRISASLHTVEFHADGDRTHLRMTEQIAVLDGGDHMADRDHGLREQLDALATLLADTTG